MGVIRLVNILIEPAVYKFLAAIACARRSVPSFTLKQLKVRAFLRAF